MNVSVCVSFCPRLREHISGTMRPHVTKFCMHFAYGRFSAVPWRQYNMLYTSGFVDDVMFAWQGKGDDIKAPTQSDLPGNSSGPQVQSGIYHCLVCVLFSLYCSVASIIMNKIHLLFHFFPVKLRICA